MELQLVKNYLQVDYPDDDNLIELMIEVSKEYITNGFTTYEDNNSVHKILLLKSVKTLYDNREKDDDRITLSLKLQQKVEAIT